MTLWRNGPLSSTMLADVVGVVQLRSNLEKVLIASFMSVVYILTAAVISRNTASDTGRESAIGFPTMAYFIGYGGTGVMSAMFDYLLCVILRQESLFVNVK